MTFVLVICYNFFLLVMFIMESILIDIYIWVLFVINISNLVTKLVAKATFVILIFHLMGHLNHDWNIVFTSWWMSPKS